MLPLAWKWQLGMRRTEFGVVGIAVLAGVAVAGVPGLSVAVSAVLGVGLVLVLSFGTLAYRFYRDPERSPPAGDGLVVSPADGEVVYVKRSRDGQLPVASKHGASVGL